MYLKISTNSPKESFDSYVRTTERFETSQNDEISGFPVKIKEEFVFFEGYAVYQDEKVEVNGCFQTSEMAGVVGEFLILKSEKHYSLALNLFCKDRNKNAILNINSSTEEGIDEEVKALRSEIVLRYLKKEDEISEELNDDFETKIYPLTEKEERDMLYNFETRLYTLQDKFHIKCDSDVLKDFRGGYFETRRNFIKEITTEEQ